MGPRSLLVVLAALAGALAVVAVVGPAAGETRPICYPVEGGPAAAPWTDTYGVARDGGARVHEGQDLISVDGRKDRRLLSAVDGRVLQIIHENSKGNRVVVLGDDGWFYVYLHVNNDTPGTDDGQATFEHAFAAGLTEGQQVRRCQHIAYIGDSGNAEATTAHLHFEIRRPLPASSPYAGRTDPWVWSHAESINPADSLRAAVGEEPSTPTTIQPIVQPVDPRWEPFTTVQRLVEQQYADFLARPADAGGLRYWTDRLDGGLDTPAAFITRLLDMPEVAARIAPVTRLYWAYFLRIPDTTGLRYWLGESSDGVTLGEISRAFAASAEFAARYGDVDDGGFVDLVYRNVLDRAADAGGRSFWLGQLSAGRTTRGDVMVGFSESPEYVAVTRERVRVVLAYVAMLDRSPDPAGLDHWVARGAGELVPGVFSSPEYTARIQNLQ